MICESRSKNTPAFVITFLRLHTEDVPVACFCGFMLQAHSENVDIKKPRPNIRSRFILTF